MPTLDELRALAKQLADGLNAYQPPVIITPPVVTERVVLEAAKGYREIPAGTLTDKDKLKVLFPTVGQFDGKDQGFWANDSTSLHLLGDGRFRVAFDKARMDPPVTGGSSYVNAALPLPAPVKAAKISYRVRFGPAGTQWGWGRSGKLPGLARHRAGRFPGGGNIGVRNFSARPCWADRSNGNVGLGPYVYGQHQGQVPDQWWGPNYPDGTLRWGAPIIPNLAIGVDHLIEVEHRPVNGKGRVVFKVNNQQRWTADMDLLGAGEPHEITHVAFTFMYGGDTAEYGPSQPVTVCEVSEFKVVELLGS